MLAALQLMTSFAGISALTKATKEQGKCKADTKLMDLAPASLVKLNSKKVKGDMTKLPKKRTSRSPFVFSAACMNTASKLGPHTQTDRGTCPGVGL